MKPSLQLQRNYLFQVYFGIGGTELNRFVSRAYRDMDRTLRGIRQLIPDRKMNGTSLGDILFGAKQTMMQCLDDLKARTVPDEEAARDMEFDAWHSKSCKGLAGHQFTGWFHRRFLQTGEQFVPSIAGDKKDAPGWH